jgi:hypothetical protein
MVKSDAERQFLYRERSKASKTLIKKLILFFIKMQDGELVISEYESSGFFDSLTPEETEVMEFVIQTQKV